MDDPSGIGRTVQALEKATLEMRSLVYDFVSPSVKEAGEWLGQAVKYRRLVSLMAVEETLRQAKVKLENANLQTQPVPLKTVVPLLEACSLEESPEMISRWANLLATAAVGDPVTPSYVRILSELTPFEAKLLDAIAASSKPVTEADEDQKVSGMLVKELQRIQQLSTEHFRAALVNLHRLELVERITAKAVIHFTTRRFPLALKADDFIGLTEFGTGFLRACNDAPSVIEAETGR